eukprot:TRINITY_DN26246_c0_g1_i1.p1 TRINITY_DN26246_c0_g1~~TRINITY_DN26246_c0_g1_i1.p1  ORF type:complete len:1102 (+),score=191.03 TRINITY_DN26246_c0_g1_i1:45-3350(+)
MAPISEEDELADALRAWGVPDGSLGLDAWMHDSSIVCHGSRPASAAEPIRGMRPGSSAAVLQRSQSSTARFGVAPGSRPPSRGGIQRPNSRASSRGEAKRQVWLDPEGRTEEEASPQRRSNRPAVLDTPSASRPPSRAASQPSLWGSRPASQQKMRPASRGTTGSGDSAANTNYVSKASSQRFSREELQCFKKLPTPSSMCELKSHTYFQTVGEIRNQLVESNWHLLPVLKGEFYQHPQLKDCNSPTAEEKRARARERIRRLQEEKKKKEEAEHLPDEAKIASVLNVIFPRNPKEPASAEANSRKQSVVDLMKIEAARNPAGKNGKKVTSDSNSWSPKHANPGSRDPSGSPKSGRGVPARGAKRGPAGAVASAGAGGGPAAADALTGAGPSDSRKAMAEFRARLLEQFCTLKEAFDAFARELPVESRSISKRELAVVLAHHGFEWPTREERDVIFDELDFKGDGRMTLNDFRISLEASAPVRTIEDLRRRWLASGFGSMMQPILMMTYGSVLDLTRRLSFQDFAERLSRVYVTDSSEHLAVYSAICVDRKKKEVSVAELACAVAVVSPGLLMEDLRERLIRRYGGDLSAAYLDLDMDEGGEVDTEEFCLRACGRLQLTEVEANKAFREIDIDSSGTITRSELVCAIGLSEPSLFLEDLRVKVRQRFHSFHSQLAGAFQQSITGDIGSAPQLTLQRFQELLFPLDMSDTETMALFSLIDADGDGTLTVQEFIRGVAHFAPSATLEDLRLRCYQRHNTIDEAFANSTVEHTKLIDAETFTKLLVELELYDERIGDKKLDENIIALQAGVRPQAVFDLLDVANRGEVTLARLLAALQSCGAGASVKLSEDDLKLKAKQDVRSDMAPMHRLVSDIKLQARQGMRYNEDRPRDNYHTIQDEVWGKSGTRIVEAMLDQAESRGGIQRPTKMSKFLKPSKKAAAQPKIQDSKPGAASQDLGSQLAGKLPTPHAATSAAFAGSSEDCSGGGGAPPELKNSQYRDHAGHGAQSNLRPHQSRLTTRPVKEAASGAQRSWQQLWTHLHQSPGQEQRIILEMGLQGYFQNASTSLSADGPLVHGSEQSRMHVHESMRAHQMILKSNHKGQASP